MHNPTVENPDTISAVLIVFCVGILLAVLVIGGLAGLAYGVDLLGAQA